MADIYGFDAFSPKQIAEKVDNIGVTKARLPLLSMVMLGVLAGAFIGLGALYFVLIKSDANLGFGTSQMLGGLAFSLGLLLVVVAGAELFTGNNLLAMAWADNKITTTELLRNWLVVACSNFIGAAGLAVLVYVSGHTELNHGVIAERYLQIAQAKCSLPFWTAFFRGVLCNILVCMAIWMAMAGRSVVDKAVAIVFPISAFVAAGFEHSIANMFFIPLAMCIKAFSGTAAATATDAVGWLGFIGNLIPVILGNLVGGSVLVGLVYYVIYLRKPVLPSDKT
ncbi:formate/nitrite transporter family protein [Photobacterium ganghwense]|uniref:Formate transporter n=1 Tax=Photobacterium ganghwense TaxID=320778 RepID=A0A0J1H9C2_9GAMM|nr:formate/nitrite transporter family protein [Photobacterium ganghwense]KLV08279.1 formate transporter [Photobacterium ganghwense]MBV1842909.1 formate/nitrite transporter family protein [Photobacterium ganghwense]PSU07413.1 formate/nitrite transporter family protein [Photobacterium ganghwense]QSV16150.1 formate/nitrite transporter family protein [Photobacterium ganghwense]